MLWLQNLGHNRLGSNPDRVAKTIFAPGTLEDGGRVPYAFGLAIGARDGFTMYDHTGSYAGYRSFVAWLPQPKLAIATLCNAETPSFTPWGSGLALLDRVLGVSPSPAPSPEPSTSPTPQQLQSLTGTFIEDDGTVWRLAVEHGRLVASVQGLAFVLRPLSPSHFCAVGAPQRVELFAGNGGVTLQIGNAPPGALKRFTPPAPTVAQLEEYAGRYYSRDLDLTLNVTQQDGTLYLGREGAAHEVLQPVARDDFRRGGQDVRFERNARGRVRAFRISASGADGIIFRLDVRISPSS